MHGGEAPVHFDEEIDPGTDGFAHRGHRGHRLLLRLERDMGTPRPGERVELEGGEAAAHRLPRPLRVIRGGPVAVPAVGIDADALAARPAQELVHGDSMALARDVPQRLLETADRTPEIHGPALGREVVVRHVDEVGDVGGLPPDEIAGERLHVGHDARVAVGLGIALAPSVRAALRLHLDEEQVLAAAEIGEKGRDPFDTHARDSTRIRRP